MAEFKHPHSEVRVEGVQVGPREILQSTDLYACANGEWRAIPEGQVGTAKVPGPLVVRPTTAQS